MKLPFLNRLNMRGKVWLAMTVIVLLGLGLHMFISSLRFEKLNQDYWHERQLRELETLTGISSWIFDQGIDDDEKKLLTDSSKSGKTWLWRVREDSSFTDIYYVFEPTVVWSNTSEPPPDLANVKKLPCEDTCPCGVTVKGTGLSP
jgi:hypothetical protein